MNSLVQTESLAKTYKLGNTEVPALRGLDLAIEEGEFTSISGPSGSGKTTLLNILGLIDSPTSGRVYLEGAQVKYNGLTTLHRIRLEKLGFIFQTFNLIPVLTAYENVEYPLLLTKKSSAIRKELVERALKDVKLWEFRKHKPNELSGGQRQRVAIARALVNSPRIVLADEPTANIDSGTASEILDLMRTLNEEEKVTFLFSTHDQLVLSYARRVVKLHDGAIVNA
ncbi:MAG TPA: ABC transporter ATP-binding protein [Bacteroidota bacterium]|nr:ABC transporter ATP-binding protein [Bacteroidota bacterium]